MLTVDAPISSNSQHTAGNIFLFGKLHTTVYQPLLVFGCSNSALDPAGYDIVYAERLLVAWSSDCSHEASQRIFRCSIFPVTLSHISQLQIWWFLLLKGGLKLWQGLMRDLLDYQSKLRSNL